MMEYDRYNKMKIDGEPDVQISNIGYMGECVMRALVKMYAGTL